mmetsp:Transcript_16619/g.62946  ORF Transcript_16619/g.62946 Transcript_16619/m.62946 type:complete len:430 (+) Transcript_16619:1865-3154(+)
MLERRASSWGTTSMSAEATAAGLLMSWAKTRTVYLRPGVSALPGTTMKGSGEVSNWRALAPGGATRRPPLWVAASADASKEVNRLPPPSSWDGTSVAMGEAEASKKKNRIARASAESSASPGQRGAKARTSMNCSAERSTDTEDGATRLGAAMPCFTMADCVVAEPPLKLVTVTLRVTVYPSVMADALARAMVAQDTAELPALRASSTVLRPAACAAAVDVWRVAVFTTDTMLHWHASGRFPPPASRTETVSLSQRPIVREPGPMSATGLMPFAAAVTLTTPAELRRAALDVLTLPGTSAMEWPGSTVGARPKRTCSWRRDCHWHELPAPKSVATALRRAAMAGTLHWLAELPEAAIGLRSSEQAKAPPALPPALVSRSKVRVREVSSLSNLADDSTGGAVKASSRIDTASEGTVARLPYIASLETMAS